MDYFDSDLALEVVRAFIVLIIVVYVAQAGRKRAELFQRGWRLFTAGFGLLLFASLLDITDNFDELNRFIVVGDTPVQATLEKLVGYLGGFLLIAMGLVRWIPSLASVAAMRLSDFAVDNAAVAMFTILPAGRIVTANKAACEELEYSLEELQQMRVSDFDPHYPTELWSEHWQELRQLGKMFLETQHRTKSGRLLDVEVSVAYVNCDGAEYAVASVRDVTQRNRTEEELRRHHEALARANRLSTIGEMATNIAHQLNQPLAALVNYAAVLEKTVAADEVDQERTVQQAQNVREQAMRAANIIKSMRALARNAAPIRRRVDVNSIIREALLFMETEFQRQSVSVQVDLQPSLPEVEADSVQIEQVLINLFQNAIDAMQSKDPSQREISVTSGLMADDEVEIQVSDTGEGVLASDVNSVFDPHYTTKSGGMGMGLAIGRSVAEAHGGRLAVVRKHGEGATFCLVLPKTGSDMGTGMDTGSGGVAAGR